jgi:DNA excision repair protein ERCC-4
MNFLFLFLLKENITKGYADQEELKNDLEQFALLTSNQAINGFYGGGCNDWMYRGGAIAMDMTMSEESSSGKTSSGSTIFFDNVNSFETNNQEEGIDTADQAKSDGRFVYAAYGDTLLVLTLTGERKAQIKLPPIQIPSPEDISTNSKSAPYDYYYYPPKAEITSLLLEGDKLTLLVSGYGAEHTVNAGESPVLCNYLGTRIMMYDTNEGDPHLISQKDIHGGFSQAYSITTDGQQKIGHVVTRASINTWAYLHEPLQRYQFPDEFTDEKYQEEAVKVAKELVPEFVSKLSDALSGIDLSRLSLFTDNIDDEDTLDGIMSQLRVAESISIVSSFVMEDSSSTNLTVSVSGIMQPGNWGYVYSNSQMIVLADKGWGFVEEDGEYVEMTYLLGFRFDGASTTHEIVGSVRGTPLNPYSIDLVEKAAEIHVRIATTMNFWSRSSGILLEDGTSSSTWNEIVVLGTDGSAGNLLVERSSVRLGKPNEVYISVTINMIALFVDLLIFTTHFLLHFTTEIHSSPLSGGYCLCCYVRETRSFLRHRLVRS